jgi:hypothetical protein
MVAGRCSGMRNPQHQHKVSYVFLNGLPTRVAFGVLGGSPHYAVELEEMGIGADVG